MNKEAIGNNLYRLRKSKRLSEAQISQIVGIDETQYVKIECGMEEASFDLITKLAKFYNVDVISITSSDKKVRIKDESNKIKYSKTLGIISLSISALLLILFFAVYVYEFAIRVPMPINRPIEYLWAQVSFLGLLRGTFGTAGTIIAVLFMLLLIWSITNNILMLIPAIRRSGFSKTSKIMRWIACPLAFALSILVFVLGEVYSLTGFWVFAIMLIANIVIDFIIAAKQKRVL